MKMPTSVINTAATMANVMRQGLAASSAARNLIHTTPPAQHRGDLSQAEADTLKGRSKITEGLLGGAQFQKTGACHFDHQSLLRNVAGENNSRVATVMTSIMAPDSETSFVRQIADVAKALVTREHGRMEQFYPPNSASMLASADTIKSLIAERGAVVVNAYGIAAEDSAYATMTPEKKAYSDAMMARMDNHSKILVDVYKDETTGRDILVSIDLDNHRDTPLSNELRELAGGADQMHKLTPEQLKEAGAERVFLQKHDLEEFVKEAAVLPIDSIVERVPTFEVPTKETAEQIFQIKQ